jgi:hypothetical protein
MRRLLLIFATALIAAAAFALAVACLPTYTFIDDAGADARVSMQTGMDAVAESQDAPDGWLDSSPDRSIDGSTDGSPNSAVDGPPEGSLDGSVDGPLEGSPEGSADASLAASVLVPSAGGKVFATGYGEETHLIYAVHDQRYWFFYVDDTTGVIRTRVSPDLATWTDGDMIGVGMADGNNFSVAYADVQGTDVVHLVANAISTVDPQTATKHVRATIASRSLVVTDQVLLDDTVDNNGAGTCPSDAPSVTILPDGHVYDVTAWTVHSGSACDTNVYASVGVDRGVSWTSGFVHDGYYVSEPGFTYSHELLTLPDAGIALAVWPDDDNYNGISTEFTAIDWAFSPTFALDAGAPGTSGTVADGSAQLFTTTQVAMSSDDWTTCRLSDSNIHVVRHTLMPSGPIVEAFEEAVWTGAGWSLVPAAPPVQGTSNTGVALVSGPDPTRGMLLAVLAVDNTLNVARWTSAGGWTKVGSLPGTVQRQSLAGSGCGSRHPYVFWTEGAGPYAIMAADLSGLL